MPGDTYQSAQIWATDNAQIPEKLRGLTEDLPGAKRVSAILERLWHFEDLTNKAEFPLEFVLD